VAYRLELPPSLAGVNNVFHVSQQNFYRFLAASEEKVHDGTEMTILQAVTHLTGMKSKYNLSNQCYNDIMKFIIDLIPVKHNLPKTCTN
jgi:hypothetical protein